MLMLWSAPRSRSTAFYRMMIERGDFTAGDLMNRPADTIKAYCARVGIDFRPHALSWQPSDRPEWQPFRNWFTDVAASSGLAEVPSRRRLDVEQHPMLDTYLNYHLPFYQKLYQRRLMVLEHRGETNRGALDPAPSCGDDRCMRFPWQPQEYTRTCAQCGTTWQVPRSARRWRSRLVSRFVAGVATVTGAAVEADPAAVARTVDSISERNRQAEARHRCPQCHADHFTQRASRGELPLLIASQASVAAFWRPKR